MPRDVVPIETRPSRPSDIFSIIRCAGNSTCARLLMNRLPVTSTPAACEGIDLAEQRRGVDHQPVADHGFLSGTQDAARNQLEDEFFFADEDRVARIVSALIARDDIEPFGEEIDDFAFTLIAPLRAEDDYVSHFDQT